MTQQQETRRQNMEQERGRQAWENIREIKSLGDKELEKKYRSLARGLNAMIQINGLGQTLGFLKAKSKEKEKRKTEHFYLLTHLSNWMRGHFSAGNLHVMEDRYNGFLSWVVDTQTTSTDYRHATAECLAFGTWLSRFAEAELEDPDQKTAETNQEKADE